MSATKFRKTTKAKSNKKKLKRKNDFKIESKSNIFKKTVGNRSEKTSKKPNKSDQINKERLKKYERGEATDMSMIKVAIEQKKIAKREKKIQFGLQQSVKSEILLTEDSGFLEVNEDEVTTQFTQTNIKNSVDPLSASKRFDLDLRSFGPYRMTYTRNGRFLLLGGRKGHIAALDWITKKLLCEINVMESVHDVSWLHQETIFAVAQKKWVYFYDNQGTEIHCVKKLYDVYRMMFLPYHFLLATVSNNGFISWLDVSIGQMVEQFHIQSRGIPSTTVQHPANAMICIGEPNGTISFWSPNSKKPAVTKLCHKAPLSSVAFDPKGLYFTTAGIDKTIKLWDARNLGSPIQHYIVRSAPHCIAMSQKNLMALGTGNLIEVYNDKVLDGVNQKKVYLRHNVPRTISNMEFCPFEDILGVGHFTGFTSMLVPGSGEPNFDALEINPFQTKSQRKEAEVKALLGKIPSDLISWDTTELRKLDIPSMEEIIEAKKQIAYIKPPNIHFVPRKKKGKKGGSAKAVQRKKIMKEEFRKDYVKQVKELRNEHFDSKYSSKTPSYSVLDRFRVKPKN